MGWPKGKPRKPRPEAVPTAAPAPEEFWRKETEARERVLRDERDEPESRQEGALRAAGRDADPLVDDDLEDLLRDQAMQTKLPSPPPMPGWHQFWGSTTNQYTPIQMYLKLGYVFVNPDEIPEWRTMRTHSAMFSTEVIQCNEMILLKVPMDRYQRIMKYHHHDRPNQEAERLRVNQELLKQEIGTDSQGNSLIREEGDGFASVLDRRVRSGRFE